MRSGPHNSCKGCPSSSGRRWRSASGSGSGISQTGCCSATGSAIDGPWLGCGSAADHRPSNGSVMLARSGRWSSTRNSRCTCSPPSRACRRSISRVSPSARCVRWEKVRRSAVGGEPVRDRAAAARGSARPAGAVPAVHAAAAADDRRRTRLRSARPRVRSPAAFGVAAAALSCSICSVKRPTLACCAAPRPPADSAAPGRRTTPARWYRHASSSSRLANCAGN